MTPSGERYVGNWSKSRSTAKAFVLLLATAPTTATTTTGRGRGHLPLRGLGQRPAASPTTRRTGGVYVWQSGSRAAVLDDNDIDGKGVFTFANYATYKGEFKHARSTRGIFTWKTGNVYKASSPRTRCAASGSSST